MVTGEAILGANIFRDFFAGIRDIVGGRSGAYEKELRKAREIAFKELGEQAEASALMRSWGLISTTKRSEKMPAC